MLVSPSPRPKVLFQSWAMGPRWRTPGDSQWYRQVLTGSADTLWSTSNPLTGSPSESAFPEDIFSSPAPLNVDDVAFEIPIAHDADDGGCPAQRLDGPVEQAGHVQVGGCAPPPTVDVSEILYKSCVGGRLPPVVVPRTGLEGPMDPTLIGERVGGPRSTLNHDHKGNVVAGAARVMEMAREVGGTVGEDGQLRPATD